MLHNKASEGLLKQDRVGYDLYSGIADTKAEIPSQWHPNVQPNQFESAISRQNNGGKFFTLFDAKYTSLVKF